MSPFQSGSAYAMSRDIANGHIMMTDRSFRRLTDAEIGQLSFEVERYTRELRAEPHGEDILKVRERNQKLSRLTRVSRMITLRRMSRK